MKYIGAIRAALHSREFEIRFPNVHLQFSVRFVAVQFGAVVVSDRGRCTPWGMQNVGSAGLISNRFSFAIVERLHVP